MQQRIAKDFVAQSKAEGVDPTQAKILSDGVVDYAEYESAMSNAFACMREAGLKVTVEGTHVVNGQTLIKYGVETPSADTSVMDGCDQKYAVLVDTFWQSATPDAVAFRVRRDKALLPTIRTCLTAYGVEWSDDESMDDLIRRAIDHDVQRRGENCYVDIGYDSWHG